MIRYARIPVGWFTDACSLTACEQMNLASKKVREWFTLQEALNVTSHMFFDLVKFAKADKIDVVYFCPENGPNDILIHPEKFLRLCTKELKRKIRSEGIFKL